MKRWVKGFDWGIFVKCDGCKPNRHVSLGNKQALQFSLYNYITKLYKNTRPFAAAMKRASPFKFYLASYVFITCANKPPKNQTLVTGGGEQIPPSPGIVLQGLPPIGGTGALWRIAWLIRLRICGFACNGLKAEPSCIVLLEANKMMNMNKIVKKRMFVLWNSIFFSFFFGWVWWRFLICKYKGFRALSLLSFTTKTVLANIENKTCNI